MKRREEDRGESRREMALRHVIQGEALVDKQKRLIDSLARDGHDTFTAEKLLHTLEATLREYRVELDMLANMRP